VPTELTPSKGIQFESDESAYSFYNEYGRAAGFSVKKEYVNKCKKTGIVTSRRLVCEKEGIRCNDNRNSNIKNLQAETRCGCDAHLVIMNN
jgi:zinc finger SWIM domain-containing protein 3